MSKIGYSLKKNMEEFKITTTRIISSLLTNEFFYFNALCNKNIYIFCKNYISSDCSKITSIDSRYF